MKRHLSETAHYRPIMIDYLVTKEWLKNAKANRNALVLYLFYFMTTIKQKTVEIECSLKYAAKALGMDEKVLQKAKNQLKEMGLIQAVFDRDEGRCKGHFIKVFHYPTWVKKAPRGKKAPTILSLDNKLSKSNEALAKAKTPQVISKSYDDFDTKYGTRLKDAIIKNSNQPQIKFTKYSTWAGEVQKLRVKHNTPKKIIRQVLDWYIENLDKKYTPKIYKVSDLLVKFTRIKDAMERKQGSDADTKALKETIKVSDRATHIFKELIGEGPWPTDTEQLPILVQQSLDEHELFLKHHSKLKAKLSKRQKEKENSKDGWEWDKYDDVLLLIKTIDHEFTNKRFIAKWWLAIYHKLKNWRGFNGNLNKFTFCVDSKMFMQVGRQWCEGNGIKLRDWNTYHKLVCKAMGRTIKSESK